MIDLDFRVISLSVFVGVFALFSILMLITKNYIKVPPNKAAVVSGLRRKTADGKVVGFRVVKGGAFLRIPVFEIVDYLSLNVFTIPLTIVKAYTLKGVPVSVKAVANVKIRGEDAFLQAAAERFLGMSPDQVQRVIFQTLEGHLRAILGTLTVEEVNSDRQTFAQKLTSEAAQDLGRMGVGIDVLTVQEISDEEQYLDSLGRKQVAEIKKNAEIGEAEAHRDSTQKSAEANLAAQKVKLDADANIALATRDLETKKASYTAEVSAAQAKAAQAGPLAEASAKQAVTAEQVKIKRVEVEGMIAVQEQEVLRKQKELEATQVRPAEAAKQVLILQSEAEQQRLVIEAQGKKNAAIALAEAEKARLTANGEGEAAAILAKGEAEAQAIKLRGLAEADVILKKAEAYKQFNDAARLLAVLEKSPEIVRALAPVFKEIAEPISNIDKVVVIDQGTGNPSDSGIARFGQTAPTIIFGLMEKLKALGIDISGLNGLFNGEGAAPAGPKDPAKTRIG